MKFIKNPWVLGIGTTVIGGIILSFVLDWVIEVDWLNTLKAAVRYIVDDIITFLNLEIKVWWLLVAIALVVVVLFIIVKFLDAKEENFSKPFLSYTRDSALGLDWKWEYSRNYDGKYTISNFHPVCSKCGMRLKQSGMYGREMICLRCNTINKWENHYLTDAQLLIEDNIKKRLFQNK